MGGFCFVYQDTAVKEIPLIVISLETVFSLRKTYLSLRRDTLLLQRTTHFSCEICVRGRDA